jgi:hypothetical protein
LALLRGEQRGIEIHEGIAFQHPAEIGNRRVTLA